MTDQLKELERGVVDIHVSDAWRTQLAASQAAQKPLRVKLGLDPTAPDIHLGHTVVLNKLRQFQRAGHQVILVIGDFTARIGDPTGKNVTRQPLSEEAIARNAATYEAQIFKLLDPDKTEVVYNSQWMNQQTATDLIRLASTVTVAQMLEREDFHQRYRSHQPIALHEFLYPLLQAYDSVVLKADVELGGTDQTFNLLMGRELQRHYDMPPQTVMTLPLLEGLDGVKKMSKSLDNYIGIDESPTQMFGKVMSVSDDLMWRYLSLLSDESTETIDAWRASVAAGENPMEIKFRLAKEMVSRFHDAASADAAHAEFISRFRQQVLPDDLVTQTLAADDQGKLGIGYVLVQAGLVKSTSEALRMVKQGAVKIDGTRIDDGKHELSVGQTCVVQVGKRRVAKVTVQ